MYNNNSSVINSILSSAAVYNKMLIFRIQFHLKYYLKLQYIIYMYTNIPKQYIKKKKKIHTINYVTFYN